MEKIITDLIGKRVDINCGNGVAFSGEIVGVEAGVLTLTCDAKKLFIDISKVVVVTETADAAGKPGFIG